MRTVWRMLCGFGRACNENPAIPVAIATLVGLTLVILAIAAKNDQLSLW